MLVGLTYDLRSDYLKEGFTEEETAEFDRDSTLIFLEEALQSLGYQTDRIGNVRHLINRLAGGSRWDIVFNICEGLYGIGREAQVPAILDSYQIPYTFSDPLVLSLTLHKGLTKTIIRANGIETADYSVVYDSTDVEKVRLNYPLFVKPVAEGTGKGIDEKSRIDNPNQLREVCAKELLKYPAGLLIERYLSGREITVGILGTGKESRVIGTMEILFVARDAHNIYSLQTKSNYEALVQYRIPEKNIAEECAELALKVWQLLGCRDAGRVDIRYDAKGTAHFIEVNPLAGLDKKHSDLPILAYKHGYTYNRIIEEIMNSALMRIIRHE
jgi:D-alanine-D-alanine ligase